MNIHEQNFIHILSHVCHKEQELCLQEPVDFAEILLLANRHQVMPLVLDEINLYTSLATEFDFTPYRSASLQSIIIQSSRNKAFYHIYQAFLAHGYHPIVMKGYICRQLYGSQSRLRSSNDEDILIQASEFEAIRDILLHNGFECEREYISAKQLDAVQEITFEQKKYNLKLELHINPIGKDNAIYEKMNSCFMHSFEKYMEIPMENSTKEQILLRTFTPTQHLLFLIFHAYKHLTVSGTGIRQIMDILKFQEYYEEQIDFELLLKALKDTNVYKYYIDILYIGNHYLGFTFTINDQPTCPDALLEDLMLNGIFGNETQAQKTALSMTRASIGKKDNKSGRFLTLLRTLFPSRDSMIIDHPELVDRPYILPILWIKRWGRFLQHSSGKDNSLVQESLNISKRRIQLINRYK